MRRRVVTALALGCVLAAEATMTKAYAQSPAANAPVSAADAPVAPSPTGAAPSGASSENRALAETLFFTGRGLIEAKRFPEACAKFEESYRLDPAAGTLLNSAVCHETIGKIATAWGEFRQALSDAKKASRADRLELAEERIKVLEPDLPYLTVDVPDGFKVKGLEIVLNGLALRGGAWNTELPVDPGRVELATRAPGYKTQTKALVIVRRQHSRITIDKLVLLPPEIRVVDRGLPTRKIVGLVVAGLGVASLAVGAVLGVAAIHDRTRSDNACPVFDGERRCTDAGASAMADARTAAWISDVGFGVGIASLAAFGVLFFTGAQKETAAPTTAWSWSLRVAGGGAQGFFGRSF